MTDREMLELAAKAAGYELVFPENSADRNFHFGPDGKFNIWNPLTDDGDALRLAACLDMMLTFSLAGFAQACSHDGMFDVDYSDDRCAAMRRAIVSAAAQIGKEMK